MPIYEGSRYEHSDVVRARGSDGIIRQSIVPEDRASGNSFQFSYYTVQETDRLDVIAQDFLGDPEKWWLVADYNPQWLWFENIPAGVVLRVPNAFRTS